MLEWFLYTSGWYVMLLAIGIIFFPFTRTIFHSFYDYGYGFAKAFGISIISYIAFTLGSIKLVPFTAIALYGIVAVCAFFSYKLFRTQKKLPRKKLAFLVLEEVLFVICLFTWSYIRAQDPALRGLEKFMDFGFINSALRGDYFPSKDMWLAGKSINYYYFGHVTGAVLTRLSFIPSYISYNLILAQLFALSIVGTFSLAFTMAYHGFKKNLRLSFITGFLATFLTNVGGNLHTIYAFTAGYPSEKPVPFWEVMAKFSWEDLRAPLAALDKLPSTYWYPNATRFIPFTIHEFPLYSYVVADLHGHVFDIPFVLMTIGLLFSLFMLTRKVKLTLTLEHLKADLHFTKGYLGYVILLGFFLSVHLMTNAFDAPIYLGLAGLVLLSITGLSKELMVYVAVLCGTFIIFNQPFSQSFEPFATGVGINCAPATLSQTANAMLAGTFLEGKFIFENNCQSSAWWMLLTLWGFFLFNFIFFILKSIMQNFKLTRVEAFMLLLFSYSTILILVPEFIYAKDIYPSHFRANTMFKLGYEAFIMMSIASAYTFALMKRHFRSSPLSKVFIMLFIPLFSLVALYPSFAIDSYYGNKEGGPQLDGQLWAQSTYPEYYEMIQYFNTQVTGQPNILEAQGDSYTDFNLVSAYTGLPTIGGWYVHEWLWRGYPEAVGSLQADIQQIYESTDTAQTMALLHKHRVEYVIIGRHEKEKYPQISEDKFEALGKAVFRSKTTPGVIYQIPVDTN